MGNLIGANRLPVKTGIILVALMVLLVSCGAQGASTPAPATPVAGPAGASSPDSTAVATEALTATATTQTRATAETADAASPAPESSETPEPPPTATGTPAEAEPTVVEPTVAAAATSAPTAAPATAVPQLDALRLGLSPVAEGLSRPVFLTHAGDQSGRLFVVEKTGAIRIVAGGTLLETPFLQIQDRVNSSGNEQGLLGVAFPPDYATRRFFFVNYTDRNGDTVVSRFNATDDPNIADPGSEFKVLGVDQPASNHNGGNLVFGPDGYLWIGMGDGGAANDRFGNGQNPATLLGKMLRLDVTSNPAEPYVIPQDNPWVQADWNGQDMRDEVWALGLRNPWRYSFDRATGDLWIADVGQNRYEEVHVVRASAQGGLNFGWPIMEGASCLQGSDCNQDGFEQPVAVYSHGADGCSVTGGYVYRGAQFPALQGIYLFGDYCSGRVWALDAMEPGAPVLVMELGAGLSSFGEDEDGELYVTDLARGLVQQVTVE